MRNGIRVIFLFTIITYVVIKRSSRVIGVNQERKAIPKT